MTEHFSTSWDIPDFDRDEWYNEELQYHQQQTANFVDTVRQVYGEQLPEYFTAEVSTREESVNDSIQFMDIEGGQVSGILAGHITDKGFIEMNYMPAWKDGGYKIMLEGSTSDRDVVEDNFEETLRRRGLPRFKDVLRLLR